MSILDTLKLSINGRLEDPTQWSEEVAAALAARDCLILTPAHWEILHLMRAYYTVYNISPIKKLLRKEIHAKLNDGKNKVSNAYLDHLFPNGVLTQGTKIAGLPVPMLDAEIEEMHITREKPKKDSATAHSPFVDTFEFEGKAYGINASGNLADLGEWHERLAEHMAKREDIDLTPDHWEVINYLRKFYFAYGIAPMVRLLMKHMRQELGEEKSSRDYLYRLFPGGPSKQGSRIAGLPQPQGCIDE